jgi:hypothetical protein
MRSSRASRSPIVMRAIRAIRSRVTSDATLLFATAELYVSALHPVTATILRVSELSRRESAAVGLLALPIWGVMLVLLYTHRFEVVRAAKDPLFWLVVAAQIWWHRFAVRDVPPVERQSNA